MNHYGIDTDVVVRLVGAMLLGAGIGLERELAGHTAGLRTHIAVCVGAALFGVISTLGFTEYQNIPTNVFRADVTRVASQVVVGVGFLGGGMIMRRNGGISNLTTAASVWAVAAIGLAAGVGDLGTAAVATVVSLAYLVALLPVRRWIDHTAARAKQTLAVTLAPGVGPGDVIGRLDGHGSGVAVRLDHVEKENGRIVAVVSITGRPEAAVVASTARLAALAEVSDLAPR